MTSGRSSVARLIASAAVLLTIVTTRGLVSANAQEVAPGITQPTIFPAFDPSAPSCSPPPDLKRVLAYVQENERKFLRGVDYGLSLAAKNRRLDYRRVVVENDTAKAVDQIRLFRLAKTGALIGTSSDPRIISHSLQEVIWSGAFVGTIVPPRATLLLNAPQYATGKALTDAAIAYI